MRRKLSAILLTLVASVALAQTPSSVKIYDKADGPVNVTTVGSSPALDVNVVQTTSPAVTGTVTCNQGTSGSAWPVSGPLTDAQLRAATVPVSGSLTCTGPLTDAQLRAVAVPVSGTVSAAQSGTWNVTNVSGTVSLPTGAATETTLGTRLAESTFTTRIPVNGQGAMAASVPVVIASNQSAVPVSQSGTWTVQPGNTANTTPWLTESPKVASAAGDGACASITGTSSSAVASNASRRAVYLKAKVTNTDDLYVKLGATATSSDLPMAPGDVLNLDGNSIYTGVVDAISASGTQSLCFVELN